MEIFVEKKCGQISSSRMTLLVFLEHLINAMAISIVKLRNGIACLIILFPSV